MVTSNLALNRQPTLRNASPGEIAQWQSRFGSRHEFHKFGFDINPDVASPWMNSGYEFAAGQITLAELTKLNNENLSGGVADELLEAAPLLAAMAAIPSSYSDKHAWQVYNDAANVGFRAVNNGRPNEHATDHIVDVDCTIMDASDTIDIAWADGYRFGREAAVDRGARRKLRTAFARLERQVIYGQQVQTDTAFGDAAGFHGIADWWDISDNTNPDSRFFPGMVIDAGGATNLTSVYLIRSVDPMTDAAVVLGNDGVISISPTVLTMMREQGNNDLYGVLFTNITSWYGFQYGSQFCVSRIANVDSTAGTPSANSPVVTDDVIAQALSLHPTDRQPNLIAMNRQGLRQLRESRMAITRSTTGAPSPFPDSAFGIPIIVTDQIANNEAQLL